jgi:hypothetical protein
VLQIEDACPQTLDLHPRTSALPRTLRRFFVRHVSRIPAILIIALAAASPVCAADEGFAPDLAACTVKTGRVTPWAVNFGATPELAAPEPQALTFSDEQATAARRVVAFEYSEGYKTRAKIHRIASFAMLPLFAATLYVGQDLYNHPGESESKKGVHGFLGASTGVLFGINSVTGVWNLLEARKDPTHRTKRTVHGILMMAADAGFFATALTIPDSEGDYQSYTDSRSTHRTLAISSMAIATVGYLIMLFGN